MDQQSFRDQAQDFLTQLFQQLTESGIELKQHWSIDHLCYRTDSTENYLRLKEEFGHFSDLLIESDVNGRPISTFKLRKPISFKNWQIDVVELPAPKQGKKTLLGFEHIEVVCDCPFEKLKSMWSKCSFDESGLQKIFNQEFEIPLKGCAIKFHHLSLESVVRLEKNTKVYSAIMDLKILKTLQTYRPLIAGTFPLGISVDGSDVDVILKADQLDSTEKLIRSSFGQCEDFDCCQTQVKGLSSFVAKFKYSGVKFELFCQSKESVEQTAYRHFQLEERLLRLGGSKFVENLLQRRQLGEKTEAAFASLLGLPGDPFDALLGLFQKSELELQRIVEGNHVQSNKV